MLQNIAAPTIRDSYSFMRPAIFVIQELAFNMQISHLGLGDVPLLLAFVRIGVLLSLVP